MSRRALLIAALVNLLVSPAFAAGPRILFAPGIPYAWDPSGTIYYTDDVSTGPVLTHSEVEMLVTSAYDEWSAVPTSSFSASFGGSICSHIGCPPLAGPPGNVTAATAGLMVAVRNAGGVGVVYDDTGLIIASYFGAPPGTLAIADIEWVAGSEIIEGFAVFNLTAVDPADISPPGANFAVVFAQTVGGIANLARSQTVGSVYFFDDNGAPGSCASPGAPIASDLETMYPVVNVSAESGTGLDQATVDHPDDISSLSDLYPAEGWPGVAGTITGTVFNIDGVTPLGGVNVVARNMVNPFGDAVTALSGNYTQTASDGSYTLNGLTPGATYTLHVEEIAAGNFLPHTPVVPLPGGGEEYWNGVDESSVPETDTVCSSTPITAVAGASVLADVMLNAPLAALIFADGFESGDTSAW